MNMTQVGYFLAVAELGTLTAAAESEHASVSSFSKQIHKLEHELGVTLFERRRGKRDISLTPAGEVFFDYQAAQRLMRQYGSKRSSTLRIGSLPLISCYGLASALTAFQLEHSSVRLEVYEREQANLARRLDFGQIGFAIMRTDQLSTHKYRWKPLIQDQLVLVLPKQHALAGESFLALSQCRTERFVTFDPDSTLYTVLLQLGQRAGFEPNVVASYSRHDLLLCAVSRGIGITLVPKGMIEHYSGREHLNTVELSSSVYTELGLAWLKNHALNDNERMLIEFLNASRLDYTENALCSPAVTIASSGSHQI
jgi:DNA-binding transcriptional LysR family regulator